MRYYWSCVIIKEKFKLNLTDEKIKVSIEILKDIQKTKLLIENFLRIGNNKYNSVYINMK